MTASTRKSWLVDFVALAFLWGSSFLFMRTGAQAFGPFATAFVRIALGALSLTPLLLWRGELALALTHWRRLGLAGILNSALPFTLYSYALLSISTGLSSILNASTPLFGALIARLWLKEPLPGLRALGLLVGFAGVVALTSRASGGLSGLHGSDGLAWVACLLATVCYGLAACYSKKHLQALPSMVSATGSLWAATLVLAPLAVWTWPDQPPAWSAWMSLAIAGVFSTALAYLLYFRLLMRIGPTRSMSVTYLIPVFANLLGVLVLDEVVTAWMLGCGGVILLGTAMASGVLGPRAAAP